MHEEWKKNVKRAEDDHDDSKLLSTDTTSQRISTLCALFLAFLVPAVTMHSTLANFTHFSMIVYMFPMC